MPYLSLPNFNYDSGPRRIQSGPDHEGYVVLYSGVQSTGPDEGIVVAGPPLSGTPTAGAIDYDANWRYIPSTLASQSGGLDPTPYNVSGALDTYDGVRISTRNTVAGAQIASAIGPQPGSTVNRPEKYMYFGGAAPDNQNYSPYNTPEINLAAEGKTGGGVTHKTFESSLLTNVLGSQGTSDRSQWRYHQPVYCKTYTETRRSEVPGLMSTPLRAVYRGGSTSYNYNYGGELLANRGGFEILNYDDTQFIGCPFPLPNPTTTGSVPSPKVGDTVCISPKCTAINIEWFNTDDSTFVGSGFCYIIQPSDVGYRPYVKVTYNDNSFVFSDENYFGIVTDKAPPGLDVTFITDTSGSMDPYVNFVSSFSTIQSLENSLYNQGVGVTSENKYSTCLGASTLPPFISSLTSIEKFVVLSGQSVRWAPGSSVRASSVSWASLSGFRSNSEDMTGATYFVASGLRDYTALNERVIVSASDEQSNLTLVTGALNTVTTPSTRQRYVGIHSVNFGVSEPAGPSPIPAGTVIGFVYTTNTEGALIYSNGSQSFVRTSVPVAAVSVTTAPTPFGSGDQQRPELLEFPIATNGAIYSITTASTSSGAALLLGSLGEVLGKYLYDNA
jgi:hypothetical protein